MTVNRFNLSKAMRSSKAFPNSVLVSATTRDCFAIERMGWPQWSGIHKHFICELVEGILSYRTSSATYWNVNIAPHKVI